VYAFVNELALELVGNEGGTVAEVFQESSSAEPVQPEDTLRMLRLPPAREFRQIPQSRFYAALLNSEAVWVTQVAK